VTDGTFGAFQDKRPEKAGGTLMANQEYLTATVLASWITSRLACRIVVEIDWRADWPIVDEDVEAPSPRRPIAGSVGNISPSVPVVNWA